MAFPRYDFEERVALVTGGGSGIGRAAALAFAEHGARVVIAGRNVENHEATVAMIHEGGAEGLFVRTDVTVSDQVEAAVDATLRHFGRLDFAFNNAGFFGGSMFRLHEASEQNFDEVVAVNLKGTWLCMKYEIAAMLQSSGGSIVNCSSIAGVIGTPRSASYTAAKHGVIGMTKAAAIQYAERGIRVNVVSPGSTDTEMLRTIYPDAEDRAQRASTIPLERLANPREIAEAALWLCSDGSSFITGQSIVADGGVSAGGRKSPKSSS
ncbi:MAG: glucose 1-dehydrogenase [Acidobacteriota bacterium]